MTDFEAKSSETGTTSEAKSSTMPASTASIASEDVKLKARPRDGHAKAVAHEDLLRHRLGLQQIARELPGRGRNAEPVHLLSLKARR